MFNSQKTLPLRMCPLELELTLAPKSHFLDDSTLLAPSTVLGYSQLYSISDLKVIYDQVMPDEAIVNQFYQGLLSNQIMSVPVLTAYQFSQDIPTAATSVDITASRAFSKISSIFVTFANDSQELATNFKNPSVGQDTAGAVPDLDCDSPPWAPSFRLSI